MRWEKNNKCKVLVEPFFNHANGLFMEMKEEKKDFHTFR